MKVLVTGGAGYVGSILVKKLLERGYTTRVVDWLQWDDESVHSFVKNPEIEFIKGDLRKEKVQNEALDGVDAAVHLAAVVGDPACKEEPELAKEINWEVSRSIFDKAEKMGVKRFVFASTCSNYGKMADSDQCIDEDGVLNPVSLYARLKVKFENYLLQSKSNSMTATSLRFSTVYGASERMRFDLTVNEFVREVYLGKELKVYGEQFWRPYCHVGDIARACICVLEANGEKVDRQVFNVGDTSENYQKKTIVERIAERVPKMNVSYVHKEEDPRDYRVNFDKIRNDLNFRITMRLEDGIEEVIQLLKTADHG